MSVVSLPLASLFLVQLTLADAYPTLFPLQDGDQRQARQVSGFLQLTLVDAYPDLFSDQ